MLFLFFLHLNNMGYRRWMPKGVYPRKSLDDRRCHKCGTDKTGLNGKGYALWYRIRLTGYRQGEEGFLCQKCAQKGGIR